MAQQVVYGVKYKLTTLAIKQTTVIIQKTFAQAILISGCRNLCKSLEKKLLKRIKTNMEQLSQETISF